MMEAQNIDQVYEQQIKPLPLADQLRLVELIARYAARSALPEDLPLHSIMELHGLGAEIWEGVDAQEYINKLREEWDT
jgi:hypothetical protein